MSSSWYIVMYAEHGQPSSGSVPAGSSGDRFTVWLKEWCRPAVALRFGGSFRYVPGHLLRLCCLFAYWPRGSPCWPLCSSWLLHLIFLQALFLLLPILISPYFLHPLLPLIFGVSVFSFFFFPEKFPEIFIIAVMSRILLCTDDLHWKKVTFLEYHPAWCLLSFSPVETYILSSTSIIYKFERGEK